MTFTTLFFDLDDTLYPASTGLWLAIRQRMSRYMIEKLGFDPAEVEHVRQEYFTTYGTTLRGLLAHYPERVHAADFLAYVHDLPLPDYLQPNAALRPLLLGLPQRRWIFTNADAAHAQRVMAFLGVSDCFAGIADITALGFNCKPTGAAYQKALELAGETDPRRCVLLDDAPRNLAPAHELGFFTVLVGTREAHPAASLSISRLEDLPHSLPELWKGNGHGQL